VAIGKAGGKSKAHSGYLDSQSFLAARNQWPKISGSKSMTKNQLPKISWGLAADSLPLLGSGLVGPWGQVQGEPAS
jgi:hypothetical protein